MLLEDQKTYKTGLEAIPGLGKLVDMYLPKLLKEDKLIMMEFVLFALAEHSLIGKNSLERGVQFKDILGSMFSEKDFFKDQQN
jgi:magnesium chelatase subunit I